MNRLAFAAVLAASRLALAESPYSLPWQLPSATIDNTVRVESAAAAFDDEQGNLDIGVTTMVAAIYRLSDHWAPTLRLGFVGNNAPGAALDGTTFGSPVAGVTYAQRRGDYRLALAWTTTIPVGTGGGDDPDMRAAKSNEASMTARPADRAMFEVDYATETASANVAYVHRGFTAQGEAALLEGVRVRGDGGAAQTRAAVGVHLGTFLGSHVSLGGDVRYERWLTQPMSADVDTLTVAAGVRLHLRIGTQVRIHPGLSYTRALGKRGGAEPLLTDGTNAIQIDLPVMF